MATNAQVAEKIGVSHSTVSRMRTGARVGSTAVLQRMSKEYEVPLQELVDAAVLAREGKKSRWIQLMGRIIGQ